MSGANAIAERRINELLDALASDDASPGAGAAAAVALALAAACARKAVAISLKHRPADAALMRASEQLRDITRRAVRGADEDARRFEEFVHSQDAGAAEKLTRAERRMQRLADELLQVSSEVRDQIARVVAGDLLAAEALCNAVLAIEANNVEESVRTSD